MLLRFCVEQVPQACFLWALGCKLLGVSFCKEERLGEGSPVSSPSCENYSFKTAPLLFLCSLSIQILLTVLKWGDCQEVVSALQTNGKSAAQLLSWHPVYSGLMVWICQMEMSNFQSWILKILEGFNKCFLLSLGQQRCSCL